MAQQKMHCAAQRTHIDNQKVIEGGMGYSLRKSLEQLNFRTSSEDCEITSLNARNSDKRCGVLTFFPPEFVGFWRIVAPAPECLDHASQFGSGSEVNMDTLHLHSPSLINSFKVEGQKARKGPLHDVTYSVKSFPVRSFSRSDIGHQYRNRNFTNKATRLNEFSCNLSSPSSISSRNSSALILPRPSSVKSSDILIENSKVDKPIKSNLRKKARKKGKQKKKLSRYSISTEPEVFSEDYDSGSLPSKNCGNNDMDRGHVLVTCAMSQEDSLSDSRVNVIDLEDNNNGISNSSESPKVCTSYIDEVDLSEAKICSTVKNFHGGSPVIGSEIRIQMEGQGFPVINGGMVDSHHLQINCYGGIHLNGLSDMLDSQVLDSISVGSNSDISTITSCDAKPCDKECNEISLSDPPDFGTRKGCFSCPNSLSSTVDFYDYTKGTRHGSQGYSSSDLQVVASGKKSKQAKMVPRSSSAYKRGGFGNTHGLTGKENSHRVWQKVQKNNITESNSEFKKVHPVGSQTLKEASMVKRNSNVAEVDMSSKTVHKKRLKDKVPRKQKRKISPASKQEYNSYSHRASYPSNASSNACTRSAIQHNEIFDISAQASNRKKFSSVPRSHSEISCPEVGLQGTRLESFNSESLHNSQDYPENSGSLESVSDTVSSMKEQNQDSLLGKSSCSLDNLNLLEVQSPVNLPHILVNDVAQMQKDISLAENSKQNHNTGSLLQKWIPIGIKNPRNMTSTRCSSLSSVNSDGQRIEDWILRSNVNENAATNSQHLISLLDVGRMSMGLDSESNSSLEDENFTLKLKNTNAHTFNEKNNNYMIADCLISETKDRNLSAVKTDLNKIVHAVNQACRMQLASEAVQMATGASIAEFEKLLYFSSPVIYHSLNILSSNNCSGDQVLGESLCRHPTPNVSLGRLWQWYEKHGSYGLEIRAEDCEESNRLGVDRFSFRAYFVPFLSAVQLFRNCKSHSINNCNGAPSPRFLEAYEVSETIQSSSHVGHLPIFSMLVPHPCTSGASDLLPENEVCKSELSSVSFKEDLSVPSADTSWSNDPEVVFEYFESEQPWQRLPLYEKIQELVRGGPSQCKVFGDPTNLSSINLNDLHPASWYSVAWYPIYRIPDGNFHAAFLTYHSLGQMTRTSAKVNSANLDTCIVSPVVGLQSYNAQSECWFQPKHTAMNRTAERSGLNPSAILMERLRTLEKTASHMSRAVVNKGNQASVNKHPDYEFFCSRQRR